MNESDVNVEPSDAPRDRPIHVCITVDTELAVRGVPIPHGDAGPPRIIAHTLAHMIVTANGPGNHQGSGEVAFDAGAGNVVRMFARSASNQFEHAVLLAGIHHARGDKVLDRFELVTRSRTGVAAASATSVFPARLVPQQFVFCECDIVSEGTETVGLVFAIYERDDRGQPRFIGLYQWEPRLTVHLR